MRNLHLAHVVGIRKREVEVEVTVLAQLHDVACGYGTVTLDVSSQTAYVNAHVRTVVNRCVDRSNGQFAAFLPAHDGRSRLRDVDAEPGVCLHVSQLLDVHDIAQCQVLGAGLSYKILADFVQIETEVHAAHVRLQQSLELLFLVEHVEVSRIAEGSQSFELFHHQFLHRKLVDDLLRHACGGFHAVDVEVNVQQLLLLQVADVAHSADGQLFVVGIYLHIAEAECAVRAAHVEAQVEG